MTLAGIPSNSIPNQSSLSAVVQVFFLPVTLQTWIAIRWRSFTLAVAVGMSATVIGFLVGQSERFGHWYPWSMPMQVFAGHGEHLPFVVAAGVLGGLAATALGLADYLRREIG